MQLYFITSNYIKLNNVKYKKKYIFIPQNTYVQKRFAIPNIGQIISIRIELYLFKIIS